MALSGSKSKLKPIASQGIAAAMAVHPKTHDLEGAADRRSPDSLAVGW